MPYWLYWIPFICAAITLAIMLYLRKADGDIVLREQEDGRKTYILELNMQPEEIEKRRRISFKVKID